MVKYYIREKNKIMIQKMEVNKNINLIARRKDRLESFKRY